MYDFFLHNADLTLSSASSPEISSFHGCHLCVRNSMSEMPLAHTGNILLSAYIVGIQQLLSYLNKFLALFKYDK